VVGSGAPLSPEPAYLFPGPLRNPPRTSRRRQHRPNHRGAGKAAAGVARRADNIGSTRPSRCRIVPLRQRAAYSRRRPSSLAVLARTASGPGRAVRAARATTGRRPPGRPAGCGPSPPPRRRPAVPPLKPAEVVLVLLPRAPEKSGGVAGSTTCLPLDPQRPPPVREGWPVPDLLRNGVVRHRSELYATPFGPSSRSEQLSSLRILSRLCSPTPRAALRYGSVGYSLSSLFQPRRDRRVTQ
jgi:hypothetical protein